MITSSNLSTGSNCAPAFATIIRLNRFRKLQHALTSLQDAYEATLEGWVRALDLREHELEGHSQRVAEMTVRLARELGIGSEELVHIQPRRLAPRHRQDRHSRRNSQESRAADRI